MLCNLNNAIGNKTAYIIGFSEQNLCQNRNLAYLLFYTQGQKRLSFIVQICINDMVVVDDYK